MTQRFAPPPPRTRGIADLGRTLCVWAHPDDETYLSGGLMSALRAAGQRVVCVTATAGERGETEQTVGLDVAQLRHREMADALRVLDVREHHWLGYADGLCHLVDPREAVRRLTGLMTQVRPDTVVGFGPDGFTGHPDHVAVAGWTAQAVADVPGPRPRLLQAALTAPDRDAGRDIHERFGVFALGEPRVCDDGEVAVRLELEPDVLARKVEALRCHHSQTVVLVEALGAERYAAWVSVETFAEPAAPNGRTHAGATSDPDRAE